MIKQNRRARPTNLRRRLYANNADAGVFPSLVFAICHDRCPSRLTRQIDKQCQKRARCAYNTYRFQMERRVRLDGVMREKFLVTSS